MDSFVVLFHVLFSLLFAIYLIIRLIRSFWGLRDREKGKRIKHSFRYADWTFAVLIFGTGLYPVIVLGMLELYHIIKFLLLGIVIYFSRSKFYVNYALVNGICIGIIALTIFIAFNRSPTFRSDQSFFSEREDIDPGQLTQLEQGRFIYQELCSPCHGEDGTLARFQAADLSKSELSREEKVDIITKGSPLTVMQPFEDVLSEKEIVAVTLYIEEVINTRDQTQPRGR